MKADHRGFTLLETVVGIVMLGISFTVIVTLFHPATEQTATILHQVRAAELGQSFLNEIQQKSFDEHSDRAGGITRCGELGISCSDTMGNEESGEREQFDDVDDYNNLSYSAGSIVDSLGNIMPYEGYELSITVGNDSDYDGMTKEQDGDTGENNYTAKLIKVVVTMPTGDQLTFSTYRANY